MAENKTTWSDQSVEAFIAAVPDEKRRADARALCVLIERTIGDTPRMWGPSIIGFGRYRYRYDSGREGEAGAPGFSPRARELVVYLPAHSERTAGLLERLGKHKAGKSCVYIKKLDDVDQAVLAELIADSYRAVKERYPDS